MRSEENPLDLNNLPDDYSKDIGKHALIEESCSSGYRKKKNGAEDVKDDGKVYECRFCSLKFCKSQALGGHMNRHRQERETETLNKARQLVFGNENSATQQPSHHSYHPQGGYHHSTSNMGSDPNPFPLRFPTRMFSASSKISNLTPTPTPPPPSQSSIQNPHQPYNLYPSHSLPISFNSSQYPQDYYLGHALTTATTSTNNATNLSYTMCAVPETSSYTCIGAPLVHGFIPPPSKPSSGRVGTELERSSGSGRSYAAGGASGTHGSSINRFQDGF